MKYTYTLLRITHAIYLYYFGKISFYLSIFTKSIGTYFKTKLLTIVFERPFPPMHAFYNYFVM